MSPLRKLWTQGWGVAMETLDSNPADTALTLDSFLATFEHQNDRGNDFWYRENDMRPG